MAFFVCIPFLSAASLEWVYKTFISKLEQKYELERQIDVLELLAQKVDMKQNSSLTPSKNKLFDELESLNDATILNKQKLLLSFISNNTDRSQKIKNIWKIAYADLAQEMRGVLTPQWRILEEDGNYYGVHFENILYFDDTYGVSRSNLITNGIDIQKDFLYTDNAWRNNFINSYSLKKIGTSSLFDTRSNALEVLSLLQKDSEYQWYEIDSVWRKLIFTTRKLIGANDEETIQNIYAWILKNISYSENIDISNPKIFSGIATYESKSWVCSGYTRLFVYMLSLAGIHDTEVIEWHVIDAPDFPQIGHAWVRIGEKYYDPTFDDPVGAKFTKSPDEYTFFGLPKDIFYTNRYEYNNLPLTLKVASKQEIIKHIHDRLKRLIPKYQSQIKKYPVFYPVLFREKYDISPLTKITPEILSKKIPNYKVENNSFRYQKNGKNIQIQEFEYYILNAENTQRVLELFEYNESKFELLHWQGEDGVWEWRLAYNIKIR